MNRKEYKISKVISIAESLKGRPYKYGAKMADAPRFFDCSLFTQYVFQKIGIKLPRTAIEQAMAGKRADLKNIKGGDLVFMKGELGRYNKYFPKGIGHVGIYLGDDRFVHAASSRSGAVMVSSLNNRYWRERYDGARRVTPPDNAPFIDAMPD